MPINSLFHPSCAKESIGENILSTLSELAGGLGPVKTQPDYQEPEYQQVSESESGRNLKG